MQPQDFGKMQSNAIEYAMQMQKKASSFNEKENKISDINHIYKNEEKKNSGCESGRRVNNFFSSSNHNGNKNDNDLSLILALILLLSSDGGDKMLILALLYIMT
ncbi:MAG: hypothetical protein IK955_07350 [Clostridia bacterium]|nr:hypothetical protein [Clostridia bacterium]